MRQVKTVGLAGGGVIGAGWAARCLAHGLDVVCFDPAPNGEEIVRAKVANAWPALTKLGLFPGASQDRLRFVQSVEDMARAADYVQESAPERIELKRDLHAAIDAAAAPDVVIGSSTSGLLASDIQADCRHHPDRILVAHPFNPVYLLPLCELVAGRKTSASAVDAARAFCAQISMYPLVVRKEVDGHLSDRLQEALWRENLHMIAEGVATTKELDDAVVYGPGLRWAFMGVNKTFALAGGDTGMRHFLHQFGPALKWPWTKLEAPELTEDLIDRMVDGTTEQMAGTSVAEMERLRDDCLIAIMEALKTFREGAGAVLADMQKRRDDLGRG